MPAESTSAYRIVKDSAVHRIGWIMAILLALGWLASEIPLQNASSNDLPEVQTSWRRTVDGWENASQWTFYSMAPRPALHPFYLGMMQCAAVAWIVLFCYLANNILMPNPNRPMHNINKASLLETKTKST